MYLNYASTDPRGHLAVISLVLVLTSRYYFLGLDKGTHLFADVLDTAFNLFGVAIPQASRDVRAHLIQNYAVDNRVVFSVNVVNTAGGWFLFPWQLWKGFRQDDSQRHRQVGYLCLGLLAVGMVTSLFIARPPW